jgi:predicted ATPase
MGISQNVVDVTIASLQTLPEDLQTALSVAAFLRTSFGLSTLQALLGTATNNNNEQSNDNALERLLETAVTRGLLENPVGTSTYRFVHDRVREAAYSIVPAHDKPAKMLQIGRRLVEMASTRKNEEEWMLFAGVDNLNYVPLAILEKDKGMSIEKLIDWNRQAGKKAAARSALVSAASYLQKALKLLSSKVADRWTSHYELCLDLYVETANFIISERTWWGLILAISIIHLLHFNNYSC